MQYSSGKSINHSCSIYYENSRNFGYIIQTNQVIPASNFYLFHYGIDSNNVDGSETSFNVFLYAKQSGDSNYIIDQTSTAATFGYSNNVTSNPSLSLTAYFENKNYASKTYFEIGFQIKLRGLYKTEAIVLSVNALTNDNLNNLDYECIILNSNKEKTSDFLSIEMNNFDQISIMPKKEIITFTDAYYFRCYHVIIPQNLPSNGGFNISGFIRSSNNIQITSRVSIFVGSFSFTTALSYFELYLEKKLFSSPGNTQNIQFLITSNSITLTKTSRIIVWFPFYYPDLLNHDGKILCQINGIVSYIL